MIYIWATNPGDVENIRLAGCLEIIDFLPSWDVEWFEMPISRESFHEHMRVFYNDSVVSKVIRDMAMVFK